MSDMFLLGAGFSKAISPSMPLLKELGEMIQRRVVVPIEKNEVLAFTDDVELRMTYLAQNHPWLSDADNMRNRALFFDFSDSIKKIIQEVMEPICNGPWSK
jgi:hypothetical protein